MLPVPKPAARQLREVLRSAFDAVAGEQNSLSLSPVTQAIVVLVDGLGVLNLSARSGHARTLFSRLTSKARIASGFPTTTASALASLTTGEPAGVTGMVGYRVLNPATGELVNQLNGWGESMQPARWQPRATLFELWQGRGVRSYAIGPARYADSGLTAAVLRGAEYLGARKIAERFDAASAVLVDGKPGVVYLYVPELDMAGHAHGWQSAEWTSALEELDSAVTECVAALAAHQGMVVTADHGMIDVPTTGHLLVDDSDGLLDGVALVGGEPRCLQLYFEHGDASENRVVIDAWRGSEDARSWVLTREEAIEAGWFGPTVSEVARQRIGHLIVAARKRVAYYDARDVTVSGRSMIGQHGSWTDEETVVPLLRFGGFDR